LDIQCTCRQLWTSQEVWFGLTQLCCSCLLRWYWQGKVWIGFGKVYNGGQQWANDMYVLAWPLTRHNAAGTSRDVPLFRVVLIVLSATVPCARSTVGPTPFRLTLSVGVMVAALVALLSPMQPQHRTLQHHSSHTPDQMRRPPRTPRADSGQSHICTHLQHAQGCVSSALLRLPCSGRVQMHSIH
jgi:hypothetical protein